MNHKIFSTLSKTGLLFTLSLLLGAQVSAEAEKVVIKESSFCKSLTPGKFVLPAKEGWWNWGMAPIYDDEGRLHIFNSSIPQRGADGLGPWGTKSVIQHHVADSIEGPYELVGTPFVEEGNTYHNPQITKVGDTYVLVLMNNKNKTGIYISIATAKSLYGPWKLTPRVIEMDGIPGSHKCTHVSNPTFLVDREGKFRIYYKSMRTRERPDKFRTIAVAIADKIEGPYVDYEHNPVLCYRDIKRDTEDPYAFFYKDTYYMILEDRMDVRNALQGTLPKGKIPSGGMRPGIIYSSKDGFDWGIPEIAYHTDEYYFKNGLSRVERPHILWKDGEPEALFVAHHHSREAGFYLKINNWNPE